ALQPHRDLGVARRRCGERAQVALRLLRDGLVLLAQELAAARDLERLVTEQRLVQRGAQAELIGPLVGLRMAAARLRRHVRRRADDVADARDRLERPRRAADARVARPAVDAAGRELEVIRGVLARVDAAIAEIAGE